MASRADFARLRDDPAAMLPADAFIDRPRRAFPFSIAMARWAVQDFHVRAQLRGVPRHAPFYERSHPAQALLVTARILSTFASDAAADGRTPLVLLLPMGRDLLRVRDGHAWPDAPLAEALTAAGVPVLHAGPAMLSRMASADPCGYFVDCRGHYNARGQALVAAIVAERLEQAPGALR